MGTHCTHNLCFEQKYEKYQIFLSENFMFSEIKFSIYLNRRIFVIKIKEFAPLSPNSVLPLEILFYVLQNLEFRFT